MLKNVLIVAIALIFFAAPSKGGLVKITNNFKIDDGVCYQEHIYEDKGSVWEAFDCVERLQQEELIGHIYGQLVMYRDLKAQGLLSGRAYDYFFTEAVAIQQYYGPLIADREYDEILGLLQRKFQEAQERYPVNKK